MFNTRVSSSAIHAKLTGIERIDICFNFAGLSPHLILSIDLYFVLRWELFIYTWLCNCIFTNEILSIHGIPEKSWARNAFSDQVIAITSATVYHVSKHHMVSNSSSANLTIHACTLQHKLLHLDLKAPGGLVKIAGIEFSSPSVVMALCSQPSEKLNFTFEW